MRGIPTNDKRIQEANKKRIMSRISQMGLVKKISNKTRQLGKKVNSKTLNVAKTFNKLRKGQK